MNGYESYSDFKNVGHFLNTYLSHFSEQLKDSLWEIWGSHHGEDVNVHTVLLTVRPTSTIKTFSQESQPQMELHPQKRSVVNSPVIKWMTQSRGTFLYLKTETAYNNLTYFLPNQSTVVRKNTPMMTPNHWHKVLEQKKCFNKI